jgi:hypothetical protein
LKQDLQRSTGLDASCHLFKNCYVQARFFYQHCLWLSVNKCGCKNVSDQLIHAILDESGEGDVSVCASIESGSDVDYPQKVTINVNEKDDNDKVFQLHCYQFLKWDCKLITETIK